MTYLPFKQSSVSTLSTLFVLQLSANKEPSMSQEQPQRPQAEEVHVEVHPQHQGQPVKYGDVFPVFGELAGQPISPRDAAMMQSAENLVLGQTEKGGAAAIMQSAADRNERAGLVGHGDTSPIPADHGVSVAETDVPGARIITEFVAGQVVGQYATVAPGGRVADQSKITIGEALEASALTAGDKPMKHSDAAAIQAAEARATGRSVVHPGGVAAAAQAAADANARSERYEDMTTLADVLTDATTRLAADKVVTKEDAERVAGAEMRNSPEMAPRPAGVAASVAAAARLNEDRV